ncbi:MAG: MFS transporter [Coriobacteriia bacterium]|nr:MFS transporter [Coriobacteriia bacterium]
MMQKIQKKRLGFEPYKFILSFGLVSMLMDTVYQGALAVQGPLLASFGATAFIVGLVSGLGEATALVGRLVSGPLADRTLKYWVFAIGGYAITALAVPAMGFVGSLGAVSFLIIFERFGKSLRTPSRDAMLSHAAGAVGRGKGFALHEVMDQVGAVGGPLIVSALLALTQSDYRVALGALIIPGIAAVLVLIFLRNKVPNPAVYEKLETHKEEVLEKEAQSKNKSKKKSREKVQLSKAFWLYALGCALVLSGMATFGIVSYHMISKSLVQDATVPLLYAAAMGIDGLFAFLAGMLYDKIGPRSLLSLPIVAALIPFFAYRESLVLVLIGVVLWGACLGVQESTMKAVVADMVPSDRRATAYGMFSLFVGVGGLLGGVIAGGLYTVSIVALIAVVLVLEALAAFLIYAALRQNQIRA